MAKSLTVLPLRRFFPPALNEKIDRSTSFLIGKRAFLQSYQSLYDIIDATRTEEECHGLEKEERVHEAFVHAFVEVAGRLGNLPETAANPIARLLGTDHLRKRSRVVVTLSPKLSKVVQQFAASEGTQPAAVVEKAVTRFVRNTPRAKRSSSSVSSAVSKVLPSQPRGGR